MPVIRYNSTRLHFKRRLIDPLSNSDQFEIVTPTQKWRMTKTDFYRVFPNVVRSKGYSGSRAEYHTPKAPPQAAQFLVP